MTVNELWDNYISDTIYDWDIYNEWTRSDIEQILLDEGISYNSSDIEELYDMAIDSQSDMIIQDRENNRIELYHIIEDAITDTDYSEHLNNDDIGKVLVSLANSYFND